MTDRDLRRIINKCREDGRSVLYLSGKRLTKLPAEIGQLSNLTSLYLSSNRLIELPVEIWLLSNLTELYLSNNQLTELPAEIWQLSNLTKLVLKENQLTELPAEVGQLVNLTTLSLSVNKLTKLPAEIWQLVNLTVLDLSKNQLTELPAEIGQLSNLTMLSLINNQLTGLPAEIGQLGNLTKLVLSENQLTKLPAEIWQISSLTKLSLINNQLTGLPAEIGQLSDLTELYLSKNQLTELPAEIGQLSNLSKLILSNSQLTELPREIGQLSNLTNLDLSENQLTELPSEIGHLSNLTNLDLRGNKLPIPPEIIERRYSPAEIINYYLQHHRPQARKKPLNEAKMIIVGQGEVGKTSLVKRLVEGRFNKHENKTEGIDIRRWRITANGASIRLNIWDFGGQEIMHATHQFFLTKRSLYLLVLDSRMDEQENRLEYWLKNIQSFAADSLIIVVCNKSDQQELDLDWKGLQQKYPTIKAFARGVSCQTGKGISELRSIIEHEVAQLEHIHDELLLNWFEVKNQLEDMKEDHIPYGDYQKICRKKKITDDTSQRTLIGFLHDLGIVLHFYDHPIFDDVNVLNPEWVTKGVYQVINSHELFQRKGILEIDALNCILDPHAYPRNKHMFIIGMMRKFELCFDFEGCADERFLVPDLLSKEEPDTGEWTDSLAFQYHYDVLPGSIISRFIVRMHNYISQNTYWRTGVVLISKNKENRALVKADIEEKKIFISVTGTEQTRRNFLEIIRADFEKIHATIPKIEFKEKVPIPGYSKVVVDYQHLCVLEKKGIETFIPEGLEEEVNVKQLLNGIESEKQRRENKRRGEARMSGNKSEDEKKPSITNIFYAPVGAFQQGSHSVANVTQNMTSDEMREQLIRALEAVEAAVNRLEVLPGYPKEDIIDLVRDGQIEIKKDKPNATKLKGLLSTVATSISTIASAKPAYEALKLALIYFGIPIP